jgi:transposase-like protein
LSVNTTYQWRIDAMNGAGTTTGDSWTFTTGGTAPTAPAKASNPSPSSGATGVSTTATLTWASASGAASYDIYFGTTLPTSPTTSTTGTSYTPLGLSPNTTYRWRIDAKNTAGTTSGDPWTFTTASAASGPVVSSISPNPVPAFNADQNVQVFGNNFQPNVTVDVFNSGGTRIATLSGAQVQSVTATSFTMVVNLGSIASTFGIEVVNPDGGRSSRVNFLTSAATPAVSSINPNPVPVFNGSQNVQVFGTSFQFNLTVDVFNSGGTKIGTLSGAQILSVTPTFFTMVVSLGSTAATFGFEVINPSGARSSRFSFSTQASRPVASSVTPNPVPTFNADQNVQVFGNNFQPNLTVDVFNSGGTRIATLSGAQVQSVTATSFTMAVNLGSTASTFGIEVVNPDGGRSSRLNFSTSAATPAVSSINPNPVPVFNGNQNVQVFGSNFQFNLTVEVFNAGGTKIGTLSGAQILSVTPTSFTMVVSLGSTAATFGFEVINPSWARSSRFTFSTR